MDKETQKEEKKDFSPEQEEIIRFYGKNLIVSAGAGSGKTHVVIGKIMDILSSRRASVNELLITTFTKAAASQMVSKLASKLSDKIMNGGEDTEYYMEQLELLQDASIGTLHSFCEKLVKKYFYIVGVEPVFKIIDQKDSEFFKNQIFDDIVEEFNQNENDYVFKKLVRVFSSDRSMIGFKRKMNDILDFVKAKDGYLEFFKKSTSGNPDYEAKIKSALNEYIVDRVKKAREMYLYIISKCNIEGCENIKLFAESMLTGLSGFDVNNDVYDNIEKFNNIKFGNLKSASVKKGMEYAAGLKTELSKIHNSVKSTLITQSDFEGVTRDTPFETDGSLVKKIYEFLSEFDAGYKKFKREKNLFDFSDLEEYAIEILEKEDVRELVKSQYKFIFVDEYQDTNEIQEKIINYVSNGSNLIMVGDVKQSIYGFRNSSPEIFIDKFDRYKAGDDGESKSLRMNFRSQKAVLEYCNFLFGKIMKKSISDIDYAGYHSFKQGKTDGNNTSFVDFYLCNKELKSKNLDDLYNINTITEQKNNRVNLLIKAIYDVCQKDIYDADKKIYRKCKLGDISILCRSGKLVNEVIKKLSELEISFSAKYQINLYNEEEVNLIIELLQVIQNDYDDIAVTTCLSSFCYGVTDDELMQIKKTNLDKKEYFYNIVKNYSQNYNDTISEKINLFYKDIEELREVKNTVGLYDLVKYIISKYNFRAYYLLKTDGKIREQNLNTYLDTLKEGFYTKNLTAYLNYIKGFAINDSFDIYVSGGADSITVQTIHNSKGLEYPVVILYQPEKKYLIDEQKDIYFKEKDYGITMCHFGEEDDKRVTLSTLAYKFKIKMNNYKEEMRILYVALTRAKNRLIIVGQKNKNYCSYMDENEYEIIKDSDYMSLMLKSLSQEEIDDLDIGFVKRVNASSFEFKTFMPEEIPDYKKETEENAKEFNFEDIVKVADYKYPFEKSKDIRLKNTVTALQEENGYKKFFDKKIGEENPDEISPVERGNSYHHVMEKSDLDINNLDNLRKMPEYQNVEEDRIVMAINQVSALAEGRKKLYEKMFMMNVNRALFVKDSPEEKVLIQGVVDLMLEGDNDIILVDYKTTRASEDKLKEMYKVQLGLYQTAIENYYNKKVTQKYIYSFVLNKLVEVE